MILSRDGLIGSPGCRLRNHANRRSLYDGHPRGSDDPNAVVDDIRRLELMLQGFRKTEQHIAAIHLTAGERGCPAGDPGSFAGAIQSVVIELFDEPLIAEVAVRVLTARDWKPPSERAQLNREAMAVPCCNAQQDRPCPRCVDRGLVRSTNAAIRADADKVLAFLEKEPDLFARAQIGDKGAVNVEMCHTCQYCQALIAGHHD